MATDQEYAERRADTVTVSKKAFQFASAVAAVSVVAVAGNLYNLSIDNARSLERIDSLQKDVTALEIFGQGTGPRFTADDAKALEEKRDANDREIRGDLKLFRTEMQQLRGQIYRHDARDGHSVITSRMDALEAKFRECCGKKWMPNLLKD